MNKPTSELLESGDNLKNLQELAKLRDLLSQRRQVSTGNAQPPFQEAQVGGKEQQPVNAKKFLNPPLEKPPTGIFEDPRANSINTPEMQQKNALGRFGKALGDLVKSMGFPSLEASMQAREEGANQPQQPSFSGPQDLSPFAEEFQMAQEPARRGGLEMLKSKGYVPPSIPQAKTPPSTQLPFMPPKQQPQPSAEFNPGQQEMQAFQQTFGVPSQNPSIQRPPEEIKAEIQTQHADQPPGTYPVQGATANVVSDPNLKQSLENILGETLDPKSLEIMQGYERAAEAYGKSLDEVAGRLSEQELAIKNRLENRSLTDQDKVLMAAVLLAPAILGGFIGGGRGAIGALAQGTAAASQALQQRDERLLEDEERLNQIALQKAAVAGKRLEPFAEQATILKNLTPKPGKPTAQDKFNEAISQEKLVKGDDGKDYVEIEGFKIPLDKVRTTEDIKRLKDKDIPDVKKIQNFTSVADNGLEQYIDALDKIREQNTLAPTNFLKQGLGKAGRAVGIRQTITLDDGTTHDAVKYLNSLREGIMDSYRAVKNMRAITSNFKEHASHLLETPFSMGIFEGDHLANSKTQAVKLRELLHSQMREILKTHNIDTSDFESHIASLPTEVKREKQRVGRSISQNLISNPDLLNQAAKNGTFKIGE